MDSIVCDYINPQTIECDNNRVDKAKHAVYMKSYQKRRYELDPAYRLSQISKVKMRYYKKTGKLIEYEAELLKLKIISSQVI